MLQAPLTTILVNKSCNFLADEIKPLKLHFFACSILVHLGRTAVQTGVQLLPASKKLQKLDAKLQMACKLPVYHKKPKHPFALP